MMPWWMTSSAPSFWSFGDFFVGAGGGNHATAEKFGDLYGGGAHTAASSENQDVSPG